jgi:hypothetical protein
MIFVMQMTSLYHVGCQYCLSSGLRQMLGHTKANGSVLVLEKLRIWLVRELLAKSLVLRHGALPFEGFRKANMLQ